MSDEILKDDTSLFDFTFNQDYGIIIKTPGMEEKFLDLNIFNS